MQGSVEPVAYTISELIRRGAAQAPDAVAICAPGRESLSYEQLLGVVERTAAWLRACGLGPGDRVALGLPNGPELGVAFLATASACTSAPLNPQYSREEFAFYLADLRAAAVIVHAGFDSPARSAAGELGIAVLELSVPAGAKAGMFVLRGSSAAAPAGERTPHEREGNAEYGVVVLQRDGADVGGAGVNGPDDVALVLHTSGTTSRPKLVPLTGRNLCISAENIRRTLALTAADRCLNVMPLFHIHGLVGATLASMAAGGSVVCTPGFLAPSVLGWLAESGATWYTAVPTMHQAILSRTAGATTVPAPGLRFIRSSSAALPAPVLAGLERVFGVPVLEAYGMTEASHQITSNPLPPRPRLPGSVGLAAGPAVAIMGPAGNLLPAGEIGEVVICGENVTAGYESNPDANASAFVGGWFRTGDQGRIDEDGYLHLTGRLKEIINRGGEKIAPREVDDVLTAHPDVSQAVTFAVPDPALGEDVAAAVVLRPGASLTDRELRTFAAARLAHFKVPRQVVFLAEIPKGPTGKLQRVGLAGRLGVNAVRRAQPDGYVPPETPTEKLLAEIWAEVLDVRPVSASDDFFALGGDSVLATQVVSRITDRWSVDVPLVLLFDTPVLADLARVIDQGPAPPVDS